MIFINHTLSASGGWGFFYHRLSIILRKSTLIALGIWTAGLFGQISGEKVELEFGRKLFQQGLYDASKIQFERFIESYPNSSNTPEAQMLAAESAYLIGHYQDAQNAYFKLLFAYPKTPFIEEAEYKVGLCQEILGRPDEAIETFWHLYLFNPGGKWINEGLYRASQIAMQQGHWDRAKSLLTELLNTAGTGEYASRASLALSRVHMENGDYEQAIRILDSKKTKPDRTGDPFEAAYYLSECNERLGRLDDAIQYAIKATTAASDSLRQKSFYLLGTLYARTSDPQAVSTFIKAAEISANDSIAALSSAAVGRLLLPGDPTAALAQFDRALALQDDSSSTFLFEKAKCLYSMKRNREATVIFEAMQSDSTIRSEYRKLAILQLARIDLEQDAVDHALRLYQSFLNDYPHDGLVPAIRLKMGSMLLEKANAPHETLSILEPLMIPAGSSCADAMWLSAEACECLGKFDDARRLYRTLIEQNPFTPWVRLADSALDGIRTQDSDERGIAAMAVAFDRFAAEPSPGSRFLLGRALLSSGQPESAIRFFESAGDSTTRDSLLFNLAECHAGIFRAKGDTAHLGQARRFLHQLISEIPGSSLAIPAWLWDERLDSDTSKAVRFSSHVVMLNPLAKSPGYDQALLRAGELAIDAGIPDSAQAIWNQVIRLSNDESKNVAFFLKGREWFNRGHASQADSAFRMVKSSRLEPAVLFFRSRVNLNVKSDSVVIALENLIRRFPGSAWADSARADIGERYLERSDFARAAELFKNGLISDSLENVAFENGLIKARVSRRKPLLSGLARSLEGLKSNRDAVETYLTYGREFRADEDRVFVYSGLARISQSENRLERTADYLDRVAQITGKSGDLESLGLLQFDLEQYDKAAATLDRAIAASATKDQQARLSARISIALLRLGKIPQAEVRFNVFQKSFKEYSGFRDAAAEYFFEKGKAHFENKDFEPALSAFQTVISDYKKTAWVPEAQFEIGRTRLVTNQVQQALDILTAMPSDYPGHPVLAKVYLNLGDHYFRSEQYENALSAFKQSLSLAGSTDIAALAMRYLIKLYDALRMWDAAMAMTQDYLKRFPQAEDALEKRVGIGIFYMNLNEYDLAARWLEDVKKDADPETDAEIQYWIGKSYYNMGRFERAIFEYLKVKYLSKPSKLPWDTTALYEAGQAYIKIGKPEEARRLFTQIVQKEGGSSDLGRIAKQKIDEIDSSKNQPGVK
jgi:tetratricopeptide (TPR) repeat protein